MNARGEKMYYYQLELLSVLKDRTNQSVSTMPTETQLGFFLLQSGVSQSSFIVRMPDCILDICKTRANAFYAMSCITWKMYATSSR